MVHSTVLYKNTLLLASEKNRVGKMEYFNDLEFVLSGDYHLTKTTYKNHHFYYCGIPFIYDGSVTLTVGNRLAAGEILPPFCVSSGIVVWKMPVSLLFYTGCLKKLFPMVY